jgi:hypothetical protein
LQRPAFFRPANLVSGNQSAGFADLVEEAFEVFVAGEVDHDLSGVVVFLFDFNASLEEVAEGVLE